MPHFRLHARHSMLGLPDGPKALEASDSRANIPRSVPGAVGFAQSCAAVKALVEVESPAAKSQDGSGCRVEFA